MSVTLYFSALTLLVGSTILLAEVPWISRPRLRDRIGPYTPGVATAGARPGLLSVESFRDAVGPLARLLGARMSRVLGLHDDVERRLARIHSSVDVTSFRVRQLGWSFGGAAVAALATVAVGVASGVVLAFAMLGGLGAFVILDQRLSAGARRRQEVVRRELPVVAEQIGMLLSSGWSLGGAIDRIARRGVGETAEDLRRVVTRLGQGVGAEQALAEWADAVDVAAVSRLVAVLALERQATDLGRLITDEARAMRRDLHRDLLARIERRGQQVWIPVTVATLLPGAVFIAIPFTAALDAFLST
jgi:tight adherence protein C